MFGTAGPRSGGARGGVHANATYAHRPLVEDSPAEEEETTERPRWVIGLNDAQRAAVLHDDGPLLVVAGAGSGKTRTIAARLSRLLAEGADPDRVLLLTFSRRASREMLQRVASLGGSRAAGRVWGGTFHAIANRLLRHHAPAVGLPSGFTILDQGDAADLMGVVRAEHGFAERGKRFPKKDTLLDIYSAVANSQERLVDVMRERFPWCQADLADARTVFAGFAERKRTHGVLDYDDLLLYWRALVSTSPAAEALRHRFDHVLVDEYQDTNLLQADIVTGLCPDGAGLFVVGDDAQAIYGFRAASAANMTEFPERFPCCTVVTLDRNYRSTQPILDVSNAVMSVAKGVFPKELRAARMVGETLRPVLAVAADETAEANYVCERVLELRELGISLRDQAVLFRTGHHSARLEIELSLRNIPFVKFGGLKFLEAAHVKDLLAFLRLLENPSDELAWHRVLGMLEGVGPATTRSMVEWLGLPDDGALQRFVASPPEVPPRARPDVETLRATLAACLAAPSGDAAPAVEVEAIRTQASSLFERKYHDAPARLVDLEQLQGMASGVTSRAAFLSELTIDPPSSTSDLAGPPHLDDDYLILSTIHSAKGGEWPAVFVIHAADGNIPSDMATGGPEGIEEERRLLYVALTRAMDHLHVIYPLRFYHRRFAADDGHSFSQPSRFLAPAAGLFDEPPPDQAEALKADEATVQPGADTVASSLAALWG
ncbi:MAG: ATP-dependent helicase [Acidimicrobiales bacterium]